MTLHRTIDIQGVRNIVSQDRYGLTRQLEETKT